MTLEKSIHFYTALLWMIHTYLCNISMNNTHIYSLYMNNKVSMNDYDVMHSYYYDGVILVLKAIAT